MTEIEYKKYRDKFHPNRFDSELELILLFESPPNTGKYFYNPNGKGSENLYRDTTKAFLGEKFLDKSEGLQNFAKQGLLLIDSTYLPVNTMARNMRRETIRKNIDNLIHDLDLNLKSSNNCKIIIVSRHVFDITKQPLENKFGSIIINKDTFVPYNGFGQQKKFREAIKKIYLNNKINKTIFDNYVRH